jgi:uncharacterized membrane-anchored protein
MTGTRRIAFWLVVGVQALVLVAMIGVSERALASGDEVTLRTVPVDPVDLFRGRYVTLRYEISSLEVAEGVQPGDAVYVPLYETGEAAWTGSFGFASPPSDGTSIRGTVQEIAGRSAEIDYGIGTYFTDEEDARRLEGAGTLLVTVAIDDGGQARISRVEPVR